MPLLFVDMSLVDRVFLFGKHYGESYSKVYASDPRYMFHLQNLLRKMYDEEAAQAAQDKPEQYDFKRKLEADIKDYLLYARNRKILDRAIGKKSPKNRAGEEESSI